MPSLRFRPRDDSSSHSHNVLTFAIAIGVTLGVLVLVSLSVAFSLIRRRRRAAALAATEDPNAPDPTFVSTRPVTARPGATNPASPGLTRLLNNTTLSLSRSTHTDEDTEEGECQADYDLHGLGHGARENAPAGALEPSALMRAPVSRRANPDFVPRFFAPEPEPPPPPPYAGDCDNAAPVVGAAGGVAQAGRSAVANTGKAKMLGKMNLKGLLSRTTTTAAASSSAPSSAPPSSGALPPPPPPTPPVLPTPCREEPPSYPGPDHPTMPVPVVPELRPTPSAAMGGPVSGAMVEEPPAFEEPGSASSPSSGAAAATSSSPSRAGSPTSTSTRPSLTLSIPQRNSPTTRRS